jgi:hypothetical protein
MIYCIKHFNDDKIKDTLIITAGNNMRYLPKFIVWGRDASMQYDSSYTPIPDSLKVPYTEFIYPNWANFRCRVSIANFSTDTLMDIVFYMWGKVPNADSTLKDTATALILLGRRGMDTISVLRLGEFGKNDTVNSCFQELRMGMELTDSKIRDISYRPSWILNKIQNNEGRQNIKKPDEIQQVSSMRVYPNPAVYYTNLEITNIDKGDYRVQLISLEGSVVQEQRMSVNSANELITKLDLTDIATGYYLIKITTDTRLIGTYKLLVVH